MQLDEVRPHHCHARAQRLLAEVGAVRAELGRAADARPAPEVAEARPRACYFAALATWHKLDRLAAELGLASATFPHPVPAPPAITPGHVRQVIDAVLNRVGAVRQRLQLDAASPEPAVEVGREPRDVLGTLLHINRQVSRALERPFTPGDVYRVVALAAAYAARLGGGAALASFERQRRPADCYQHLLDCHGAVAARLAKRDQPALLVRGVPDDATPGDVYDLAWLLVGELACLHALVGAAAPVHGYEPQPTGFRLPGHVDQLARTLAAQLAAIG